MDNSFVVETADVNIVISDEVIIGVAINAIKDVKGVSSIATKVTGNDIIDLLKNKNASKGVKVERNEDTVSLNLYINVKSDVRIPDVAKQVQSAVKGAVENTTGLTVGIINVNVVGVVVSKAVKEIREIKE